MSDAQDAPKVVVVTGDVTIAWKLARMRHSKDGGWVWHGNDRTRAGWQRGGAAMLADLIEEVATQLRQSGQAQYEVCQMDAPRDRVFPGNARYHLYFKAVAR